MQVNTKDLTPPALDYAVAQALVKEGFSVPPGVNSFSGRKDLCEGIFRDAEITVDEGEDGVSYASTPGEHGMEGPTACIAGLRCFVQFAFGDSVEVPDVLFPVRGF